MATAALPLGFGDHFAIMSRPIDRLPVQRPSHEPKEAMNCKSCRKRKIKCNRVRPSCEACQVFNCACIYDAVPKKRGPKTDVLEALLKRVNGLERRLTNEKVSLSPKEGESGDAEAPPQELPTQEEEVKDESRNKAEAESSAEPRPPQQPRRRRSTPTRQQQQQQQQQLPQLPPQPSSSHHRFPPQLAPPPSEHIGLADALIDTYFARLHGKPYYILDEAATRQRLRDGLLPAFLVNALYAVSVRYAAELCGGDGAAVELGRQYALQARAGIDVDEPTIEHLQALLLVAMAAFQSGRGKKSYMLLTHGISMAFALNLHRELPGQLRVAASEREGRRKLFWTCYLMDRFMVSGSKRPALISDESIYLRLPSWLPHGSQLWVDGNYFGSGSSPPYADGGSRGSQGSAALLIEIVRILGIANRYLAAGGVKGDTHFPWHTQSTLSRIRSDLDYWAANTSDTFISLDTLFGQPDSSTLVLSKLIYHLIYCLIYRPFLPVDLAELSGSGQHQSWQIEATNLCFLHANAIAELVEIGKRTSIIDWASFVGFCICTAGTIHVHGAHYVSREGDVFSSSASFLAREVGQLQDLRYTWAGVQHQQETLQVVYTSHSQLVKSLATSPMRFSPVFQMEDFFSRYPGAYIDGAHVTFTDLPAEAAPTSLPLNGDFGDNIDWLGSFSMDSNDASQMMAPSQFMTQNTITPAVRKPKRRRTTNPSLPYIATPRTNMSLTMQTSKDSYFPQVPQQSLQSNQQPPTPRLLTNVTPAQQHAPNGASDPTTNDADLLATQTFTHSALSPNFSFSPMPQTIPLEHHLSADDDLNHNGSNGISTANGNGNGIMSWDHLLYSNGDTSSNGIDHHNHHSHHQQQQHHSDTNYSNGIEQQTPSAESALTDGQEKDPFLTLLEQLAQNDGSGEGGPTDLGFFLEGE